MGRSNCQDSNVAVLESCWPCTPVPGWMYTRYSILKFREFENRPEVPQYKRCVRGFTNGLCFSQGETRA